MIIPIAGVLYNEPFGPRHHQRLFDFMLPPAPPVEVALFVVLLMELLAEQRAQKPTDIDTTGAWNSPHD